MSHSGLLTVLGVLLILFVAVLTVYGAFSFVRGLIEDLRDPKERGWALLTLVGGGSLLIIIGVLTWYLLAHGYNPRLTGLHAMQLASFGWGA